MLHRVLTEAPSLKLSFPTDKRLRSYRQMLYAINGQGKFRYKTQREGELALRIIRVQ